MVQYVNGRLIFVYGGPNQPNNQPAKARLWLSLSGILVGIFLLPQIAYLASITPDNLINLTNQERLAVGLNTLTNNEILARAAEAKGQAILDEQTFSHTINDKRFSAWVRDAGYNYAYVGENLALDFNTSEGVMAAWNASPLHKKNLLNSYYQEIGIAVLEGKFQGQDTQLVVQIFGAPASAAVEPLAAASGFNYLSGSLLPEMPAYNFLGEENLLTHAAYSQASAAAEKINILNDGSSITSLNKLFTRPPYSPNSFALTFAFLSLIYLLIYLYYYYFLKINKLISF